MIPTSLVDPPLVAPVVALFVAAFTAALARPFFLARAGKVELGAERIVFARRGLLRRSVPWSDLEAYSDASPAMIGLLRRGETAPCPRLAIPTGTEEERVRVLSVLDEHGLRRVEVALRGRRLGWALVAGLLPVGAFFLALHFANAPYRRLLEIQRSASSTEEDVAFLARAVTLRQGPLRRAVGTEDALCIDGELGLNKLDGYYESESSVVLTTSTRIEADGAVIASTSYGDTAYSVGGWEIGALLPFGSAAVDEFSRNLAWKDYKLFFRFRHGLAPGRHDVRVVSAVTVGRTVFEKETRVPLEVVPGSLAASTVALVHGATPRLSVTGGSSVTYASLEHTLAMDVEILEDGETIDRGTIFAPKGESGSVTLMTDAPSWVSRRPRDWGSHQIGEIARLWKPVLRGHHVHIFRFTPDARLAFENDATCTEIYGDPVEKRLAFDKK
jgi:hypothetical protein